MPPLPPPRCPPPPLPGRAPAAAGRVAAGAAARPLPPVPAGRRAPAGAARGAAAGAGDRAAAGPAAGPPRAAGPGRAGARIPASRRDAGVEGGAVRHAQARAVRLLERPIAPSLDMDSSDVLIRSLALAPR